MIFETERLILRPWSEDDAEDLYKYASDPAVGPIAGWPVHTDIENSREIIRTVLSSAETYAVCLKKDNRPIGSVGLIPPAQSHTRASDYELEIGYWIGVPFWGKGLIPEAVRRMQEHAFLDLKCSAMWCGYYDGNENSRHCQEKCGFTYHHSEIDKPCVLMGDLRTEHFTKITRSQWLKCHNTDTIVLYVHGKDGSAEEAEHFRQFFPGTDVYRFDYISATPEEAEEEFSQMASELSKDYKSAILIAVSIGAYFSMNAHIDNFIKKAFFISPVTDLEKLITDMISQAGTTECELEKRGIIPTEFGEDLSWEYLQYVRNHKISWNVPTEILYGSNDLLQSIDTIKRFSVNHSAGLTVMNDGEHWFHTEEQMAFLDQWMKKNAARI